MFERERERARERESECEREREIDREDHRLKFLGQTKGPANICSNKLSPKEVLAKWQIDSFKLRHTFAS